MPLADISRAFELMNKGVNRSAAWWRAKCGRNTTNAVIIRAGGWSGIQRLQDRNRRIRDMPV